MKLFKQKETYISEKIRLSGDMIADADISIDGEMYGNIQSTKHVMLGASSHVEGNIESDSAMICGYFKGRILAKRKLQIRVPATIVGDLISDMVQLESGVSIQGKILAKSVQKDCAPVASEAMMSSDSQVDISYQEEDDRLCEEEKVPAE